MCPACAARFDDSLGQLHRAAKIAACDWNLDYEAGAECSCVQLDKARMISKAALLRGRSLFVAKKTDETVADVMAVLKLARGCGGSPLMVSLLVGGVIEKEVGDGGARAHLGRLSPAQLERLAQSIEALPVMPTAADCIRHEERYVGDTPDTTKFREKVADAGFELSCRPGSGDKPVVLQVGHTAP